VTALINVGRLERLGHRMLVRARLRGSHAERTQGGGIGLSIVRRLCALYGWEVRIAPERSVGLLRR
jgi:signal transduction histidine kinase